MKEMIEEMAKDIPFLTLDRTVFVGATETKNVGWTLSEEDNKLIAKELISKGWIKPTDDSVVMSKEEYDLIDHNIKHLETVCNAHEEEIDRLEKLLDAKCDRCIESDRKKTAKEILSNAEKELHKVAKEYAKVGHKTYFAVCENIHYKVISPLAKQYGVEVK